ncbi:MAG TPA: hypothetical protein HA252_01570 [Candidatus Diapherotrites archaeon]|nr:hypothetical protein [Candidatus Diapherotrites archaeon]
MVDRAFPQGLVEFAIDRVPEAAVLDLSLEELQKKPVEKFVVGSFGLV